MFRRLFTDQTTCTSVIGDSRKTLARPPARVALGGPRGFLIEANYWVLVLALVVLQLTSAEAGFYVGRYVESTIGEITIPLVTVVAAAILGILSLLLGFTVSMAVSRFETRKQLVLAEANAIGTSYLRTQILPAQQSGELTSTLREYVDLRLQYGDVGVRTDRPQDEGMREEAARLQDELWLRAVACARTDVNPSGTALLLQSLNRVIELEKARWMAFRDTVPGTVIYVDAIVAILGMSLVGYLSGAENRHHMFVVCILALAITGVLGVIIDLDRPRRGFIRVSQQPMIDLQQWLRKSA